MALTSMDSLLRALQGEVEPPISTHLGKQAPNVSGTNNIFSYWGIGGQPGGAGPAPGPPGEICTRLTPGALWLPSHPSGSKRYLARFAGWGSRAGGLFILYDRLYHCTGDFSANATITVNGPLIDRGPYEDVEISLEVIQGNSSATMLVDVVYEDELGVQRTVTQSMGNLSGHVGRMQTLATSVARGARRIVSLHYQSGVVTGSYNVVMWRPLAVIPQGPGGGLSGFDKDFFDLGAVEILPDACLGVACYEGSGATPGSQFAGGLQIVGVPGD